MPHDIDAVFTELDALAARLNVQEVEKVITSALLYRELRGAFPWIRHDFDITFLMGALGRALRTHDWQWGIETNDA